MKDHTEAIPSRMRVAQIFNRILAEELSTEQAFSLWPSEEEHEEDLILHEAYHALQHYAADEDIRNRDADYEKYQREELQEIAQKLIPSPTESSLNAEREAFVRTSFSPRRT